MKPQDIDGWLAQLGQPSADRDYKPGHARMLALLEPLQCIRPKLRMRVVGTNGKGSTATMLAAGLQAAGLKVGLYTSPHILTFHERISIDGVQISNHMLFNYLEAIMPIALQIDASYFEVATALALYHFSQNHVDVEVLEAGVGAHFDATTAVPADMALITPIGLDHQAWLGDNLADVASEKAYALDGCRWGLSVEQPETVMLCLTQHMKDLTITSPWHQSCDMLGTHQQVNAGLACAALALLVDEKILDADKTYITSIAVQAKAKGRLQYIAYNDAHIWLDAAHNRHAIEALLPILSSLADPFDMILVYTREDRSLYDCMPLLQPFTKQMVSDVSEKGEHVCIATVEAALQYALEMHPEARILLLGSFVSVAAGLQYLGEA